MTHSKKRAYLEYHVRRKPSQPPWMYTTVYIISLPYYTRNETSEENGGAIGRERKFVKEIYIGER